MNTNEQLPGRVRCSAKNIRPMRKSCAQKELQFHGVEDGNGTSISPKLR
jgi:hypothetical protein